MAMAEGGSQAEAPGAEKDLQSLSTLFLASICQAKEHIEHLEVFFSRTLYPVAVKEAELRWDEERKSLLERLQDAEDERAAARSDRDAVVRNWEAAEYSWQQEREGFVLEQREMQTRLDKAGNEKQEAVGKVDVLNDAIRSLKRKRDSLEKDIEGKRSVLRSMNNRYVNVKMQYESLLRQQDVAAGIKSLETEEETQEEERIAQAHQVSGHAARQTPEETPASVPEKKSFQVGREGFVAFEDEETCEEDPFGKVFEASQVRRDAQLSFAKQQSPVAEVARPASAKAMLSLTTTPLKTKRKSATLKDFFSGTRPNGEVWRTTRAENKSRDPHDDFLSTPQERALQRIAEENARNRKADTSPLKDQPRDEASAGESLKKNSPSGTGNEPEPAALNLRTGKLALEKNRSCDAPTTSTHGDKPAAPASPVPDFVPDTLGPDFWDNLAPIPADEDDEVTQEYPDDYEPRACGLEKDETNGEEEKQVKAELEEHAWVKAGGRRQVAAKYKYNEPVRKKADRENLVGTECKQCSKFYDAVLPVDGHGRRQCDHHRDVSRHRYRYVPPATPEGFWNIGFSEV